MANSMPNDQKQHLPSCLTKEKVYRMYEEDMKTLHKDSKRPGYTQFRNMSVEGTFSACLNTKGMLQLILLDQI